MKSGTSPIPKDKRQIIHRKRLSLSVKIRNTYEYQIHISSRSIRNHRLPHNQHNAQQLRNPFDFPILLSGNFGELRSNHFHSGIDFKTQGVEGKPVHTVQEGYVSRISVSPWGYGNGLYITHPDGTTTVYGHLQKFSKKIANYVKEQQYAQESFNVNLFLTPDLLPVEKNEVVALSGNTGSVWWTSSPF